MTYHSLKPFDGVLSGCGGLGHLAIQYAKAMGQHVCAGDIEDSKLDHAVPARVVIDFSGLASQAGHL